MTTYTEHDLRTIAAAMRAKQHAINDLADLLDAAADGRASQAAVQAAVDRANAAFSDNAGGLPTPGDCCDAADDAVVADAPQAWRYAMIALLNCAPEDHLRVLMRAVQDGLDLTMARTLADLEPQGRA